MRKYPFIILSFLTTISMGQTRLTGKFINDNLNQNNYLELNADSTFKYRFSVCLIHDISCGTYSIVNDTIFLIHDTDLRNTTCNKEIDTTHFDSTVVLGRPKKLFFRDDKLYNIEEGKIIDTRKSELDFKPDKSLKYRRKYLLFGHYVKTFHDTYYMITESKVKWKIAKE